VRLKIGILLLVPTLLFTTFRSASSGIVVPRFPGMREKARLLIGGSPDKSGFRIKHGWIKRFRRLKYLRDRYFYSEPTGDAKLTASSLALSGVLRIPLIAAKYSDTVEEPFEVQNLEQSLFSGPSQNGTVSYYYREVSYGLFDVVGDAFGWVQLDKLEAYYTAGAAGVGLGISKTGELIRECLEAVDDSLDFGVYDNDGPDGVSNSGDDDGFVDVVVIVQPSEGYECDGNEFHMWSHSSTFSGWPENGGEPYTTNDPAAGGGNIKVEDYIIIPAISCEGGIIEIGVLCHELGHVIGLPDLYDWNGGGVGIGYWGLMGMGNWNTPYSPAHMCAWSKEQLGWLEPQVCDWRERRIALEPSEQKPEAVKIPLPARRFRRMRCGDGFAMVCGYTEEEAGVRMMVRGAGYGNGWHETLLHEFKVNHERPIVFSYDITYQMEENYDYGYLLIECGGNEDTIATYTGSGSERETYTLDEYLPAGTCSFYLKFVFVSDYSVSDEDGGFDSEAGLSFNIDNVELSGGGIFYSSDFERDSGGWRCVSPPAEYFIAEYRTRLGFDAHLPGEGLLIWHAENSIAYSYFGNSGGYSNLQARGLVLEEADGRYNLIIPENMGGNRGDRGDPFPGTSHNTLFSSNTVPSSQSNSGEKTPVRISYISLGRDVCSARFVGGYPAPEIIDVSPDTIYTELEDTTLFDISTANIQYNPECFLVNLVDTIPADSLQWLGEERVIASFINEYLYGGLWGLLLVSGDGQSVFMSDAVYVSSIFESVKIKMGINYIIMSWRITTPEKVGGVGVYRKSCDGNFYMISDTLKSPGGYYEYGDSTLIPGVDYSYKIVAFLSSGDIKQFLLHGTYYIDPAPFTVYQNYPNPFSSETKLRLFTPGQMRVSISIFDISGRLVDKLGIFSFSRGIHEVSWAPENLSSGVYIALFSSGSRKQTKKLVYIR